MKWHKINKSSTNIYKGLAIIMIVLHNFMHRFPEPKEMEFEFYDNRFSIFLNSFTQFENIIQILFSYLGHFGVQIFIFISAYGLTKRYLTSELKYGPYIWKRIITIYPPLLIAILFWAIVTSKFEYGMLSPLKHIYWNMDSILLKLSLLSNFSTSERFALVGPWWFISFIFQFYLIFPLLLQFYQRWQNKGLIILSIMAIIFNTAIYGKIEGINFYFTVIGHLPEFCIGIFLAKNDISKLKIPNKLFYFSIVIFILGNTNQMFWHISHISFLIILLFVFNTVIPRINISQLTGKTIIFLGSISMYLFLVNGFLRKPFINWAKEYDFWLLTLTLGLSSFCLSIVIALLLKVSVESLTSLFNRNIRTHSHSK